MPGFHCGRRCAMGRERPYLKQEAPKDCPAKGLSGEPAMQNSIYPRMFSRFAIPSARAVMAGLLFALATVAVSAEPPDAGEMARWIQQMKKAPKGPFDGIYWFCADGAVLPPQAYACSAHGGGIQHGRLDARARILRQAGYPVGNVLAAADPKALVAEPQRATLKAILLERYLMAEDDGWILRRARYYRGAMQVEDEVAAADAILAALVEKAGDERDFLLWRQAALLLPGLRNGATVTQVHEQSSSLAVLDPGFEALRNKLHILPEAGDAGRVRDHARRQKRTEPAFEALAQAIEALFGRPALGPRLKAVALRLGPHPLAEQLRQQAKQQDAALTPAERFPGQVALLGAMRDAMPAVAPASRLALLKLGLEVEGEAFATGLRLLEARQPMRRAERLYWLGNAAELLYGAGLLTPRERQAVRESMARFDAPFQPLERYRQELNYLARVPGWAGRELAYHFDEASRHLARIEPLAARFVQDRLRASPLLIYSALLDRLLLDANGQAGIEHEIFGAQVGAGLRALNPGLGRGILRLDADDPRPDGIYLLPQTTANLSPVAGILTLEEGNILSHVQLLAANMGIPNVVVDRTLLPRLKAMEGKAVVLAVSPGGRVLLAGDGPAWEARLGQAERPPASLQPDLLKLDLSSRDPIPLDRLGAADAGRRVGPKAAKLAELKHQFPAAVADGLVLPFGAFRAFLEQPMAGTGMSAFDWMQAEYRRLARLPASEQAGAAARLRQRLRTWVENTDPGEPFRATLRQAMAARFGREGSYGVFVRSDTNMEDLPGFAGAGLNLTVPHVVGFEQVVQAIRRVWASPFTERAFAWRQMRMASPEHVYVSVLLQRSVPANKSGVMLTMNLASGSPGQYTVAANEGVGGAVAGQSAEELLIDAATGTVRLLAEASADARHGLGDGGGLHRRPVQGGPVLTAAEVEQLRQLGLQLPWRFPQRDDGGALAPADVEFGFVDGRLALFQIRPYLRSKVARRDHFLLELDAPLRARKETWIDLLEGN